ncbi:TRAP transporter small permease [Castellaniella sp.]|uniref:TRAP transporter small permease n=1 Tax=Castellaniella sp. TaxID=1955812 RepID=UPI003C743C48
MNQPQEPGSDQPQEDIALPVRWPGSPLQTVVRYLDQLSVAGIVLTMAGMTIIVTLQVVWRHILNSSIDSADELSRLLFVWAMFLAIPQGIKYGVHVGIDLLVSALSPSVKEILFRLMSLAAAVLMAAVAIAAWDATLGKWQALMPTLPISAAVFYIAVLVCAVHSVLHLILFTWGGSRIWGGQSL